MSTTANTPLVAVSACLKRLEGARYHAVQEKYLTAVHDGAEAMALIVPALGSGIDRESLLDRVDGVILTGSLSNVEPHNFDGPASRPGVLHDADRDRTVLPLIRDTLARGVPLFCICRGMQELNVALGGTLHQHLEEVPGRIDHRSDPSLPDEIRYKLRHTVHLVEGGALRRLAGETKDVEVNSLHGQGIDRLAPDLEIEATAPDGTIEAVRVKSAAAFAIGVQWHPEWKVKENPFSLALFRAFGDACRRRAGLRNARRVAGDVA